MKKNTQIICILKIMIIFAKFLILRVYTYNK